jgi:hypothetical protein
MMTDLTSYFAVPGDGLSSRHVSDSFKTTLVPRTIIIRIRTAL